MLNDYYEIDWDKVQTVDDIKRVLKAMKVSFSEEYAAENGIADLVRLAPKNPHLVQLT